MRAKIKNETKMLLQPMKDLWVRWKNRKKKYWIRKTVKEVKRVKWPTSKRIWITFFQIFVFTIIITLFVYLITLGFTGLWHAIGVNI